jgi:hypothetical protein
MGVAAAISLVDISALDRAAGESLSVFDNVPEGGEGVTVVRVIGHRSQKEDSRRVRVTGDFVVEKAFVER